MAHYALLDENNVVVEVITGIDENGPDDTTWEDHYSEVTGYRCKRTSYWTLGGVHFDPNIGGPSENQSKTFRKNYAGKGFTYDENRDAFIPPKKFASWTLNEETCMWDPPIPRPDVYHRWDEDTLSWVPEQST